MHTYSFHHLHSYDCNCSLFILNNRSILWKEFGSRIYKQKYQFLDIPFEHFHYTLDIIIGHSLHETLLLEVLPQFGKYWTTLYQSAYFRYQVQERWNLAQVICHLCIWMCSKLTLDLPSPFDLYAFTYKKLQLHRWRQNQVHWVIIIH